jgi:predicted metal-dependent phosphoesterase TrpH
VIDLHLHTTASDGKATPRELVQRARQAGLTTISVTDHDTIAALADAASAAAAAGVAFVPGIEITTLWNGTDVHVLGYFFDVQARPLLKFLATQREDRVRRVERIGATLGALGFPVDLRALLDRAAREPERSIGRPQIAQSLVEAGHVASTREAFDRFLAEGRAAFLPRHAPPPRFAIELIASADGISSLAHPGTLGRDEIVPALARQGLTAIEAYHTDHGPDAIARYLALAGRYGLAVTGGSDYHAEPEYGAQALGSVTLPGPAFDRLVEVARLARRLVVGPASPRRV